jgi:hypothetical protein
MNAMLAIACLASLGLCLAAPLLYIWDRASMEGYKNLLLGASLAYFAFATLWTERRRRG